ncbi:MAG: hypothetical protein ACD_77C00357G0015 [uncultured bacterium]|nr:MAG: hypothetical protein ACD_77C00357G0015 [uncultured bacterium]
MKRTFLLCIALLMVMFTNSCNAKSPEKQATAATSEKVEAYYFHFTSRCVTCKAVEAEAQKDIQALYGNKVIFKSINLDDPSSQQIAEKLQVPGQALLIVKGNKIINLTNEGFLYARKDPTKFKSVIKETVDSLLK